jgi:hypothetical protein
MRSKPLRNLQRRPAHVLGRVQILFSAFVALRRELPGLELRYRRNIIRDSQWNAIPEQKVLSQMKPPVLAENYPAIIFFFQHIELILADCTKTPHSRAIRSMAVFRLR